MIIDVEVSFYASGATYKPSLLGVKFEVAHDPSDIAKYGILKGKPYGYGYSQLRAPLDVPEYRRIGYLSERVLGLLPQMKAAGADEFYTKAFLKCTDCNQLILEPDDLKALAAIECQFVAEFEQVDTQ